MTSASPRRRLVARAVAILVALLIAASGAAPAASAISGDDASTRRLLLLLDASGSMKGPDPSGGSKLEAAKRSLNAVVDALPNGTQVGLRVYGATVGGSSTSPEACADTQLVAPIAPLDRAGLKSAIAGFDALGATPIAGSVRQAVGDLGGTGNRTLILVSDGEETCVPDPCPEVSSTVGAGVDLQVDTVGFGVNPTARRQLQCIAEAGHGSYFDAADASQLQASLTKLSQRSLRGFTASGKRVTGSADGQAAPVLTPGTYLDTTELAAAKKYYAIDRHPGSTIRFNLSARPVSDVQDWNSQRFVVELLTPSGTSCALETPHRLEVLEYPNEVLTATARVYGEPVGGNSEECRRAPRLLATVQRTEGTATPVPVQLLVMEEPAATDTATLPEPTERRGAPGTAPASDRFDPIAGGGSFDDAATVNPGNYTETLLPGEQVFYRAHVEFGQQLVATVDAPMSGTSAGPAFVRLQTHVFGPDRAVLPRASGSPEESAYLDDSNPTAEIGGYSPTVMYRNRETDTPEGDLDPAVVRAASIAGYYYVSVSSTPLLSSDKATPVTVRLRFSVTGQPDGKPQYAGPSSAGGGPPTTSSAATSPAVVGGSGQPTAASSTASSTTDGDLSWVLWVGLAAVVIAAVGGVVGVRRGRVRTYP